MTPVNPSTLTSSHQVDNTKYESTNMVSADKTCLEKSKSSHEFSLEHLHNSIKITWYLLAATFFKTGKETWVLQPLK